MKKISTLLIACVLYTAVFSQNNGLIFDGSNDNVSISEKVGVLTGNIMTFEAWVKPSSVDDYRYVVNKGNSQNFFSLMIFDNAPGIDLEVMLNNGSGLIYYEFPSSPLNVWHHIAVTYNGTLINLYIDGSPAGSAGFGGSVPVNTEAVTLGTGPFNSNFAGTLDEVRIWNVARTQAQIQASMNTEISPATANLTAYYRLNQGTANGNNTAITTLTDLVAVPNNGTLNNFTKTGSSSNFTSGYGSLASLPIKDASFTAAKTGETIQLAWKGTQTNVSSVFEIERSNNGIEFTKIGTVAGTTGAIETSYKFTDASPFGGINYYRLKCVDAGNRTTYSRIITVKMNDRGIALQAYPSPAQNNLQLVITAPKGSIDVMIKDLAGRTIQNLQFTSPGSTIYTSLDVSRLAKGMYMLWANKESVMFIKQ